MSELEALHLGEVDTNEPTLVLSSYEWKEFESSIQGYAEARNKSAQAKIWAADTEFYLRISFLFPFIIYSKEIMPRIQTAFTYSREALILSNQASNSALEKLLSKTAELEYMGAGYSGYSGIAAGPYNEVRALLVQANNSELEQARYDDAARRYAAVLIASNDVRRAFLNGTAHFTNAHSFSNTLNYQLAGEDNLLMLIIGLHRKLRLAEEDMQTEYEILKQDTERKMSAYSKELSRLEKQEHYSLVSSELAARFIPFGEAAINSPAQRIANARAMLDGLGMQEDAKGIYDYAVWIYKQKAYEYAGKAIEGLSEANGMLDEVAVEISTAKRNVEELLPAAKSMAERERASSESALASFTPRTEVEADLKAKASTLLDEASALMVKAGESESDGKALSDYAEAIDKLTTMREMLTERSAYLESARQDAESALNSLRTAIELAEKDALNAVSYTHLTLPTN